MSEVKYFENMYKEYTDKVQKTVMPGFIECISSPLEKWKSIVGIPDDAGTILATDRMIERRRDNINKNLQKIANGDYTIGLSVVKDCSTIMQKILNYYPVADDGVLLNMATFKELINNLLLLTEQYLADIKLWEYSLRLKIENHKINGGNVHGYSLDVYMLDQMQDRSENFIREVKKKLNDKYIDSSQDTQSYLAEALQKLIGIIVDTEPIGKRLAEWWDKKC